MSTTQTAPAGWYPDTQNHGFERWWDGEKWTGAQRVRPITASVPQPIPASSHGPLTHSALTVERQVVYTREQKGHSLTLHLIFGVFVLFIPTIYYTVSPNHYWHA